MTTASARWCILRTSGSRTLSLVASLAAAGFDVWSPGRTIKRSAPGKRPKAGAPKPTIEITVPILPTFVFARADRLVDLAALTTDAAHAHFAFSIFRHGGLVPLVSDADVAGLQQEEAAAAVAIQQQRDAATHEEAEAIRIAALRTEQARMRALKAADAERRKLLRSEPIDFATGERVRVEEAPAMTGMTGVVISSDGRHAVVQFGGMLTMEIEAWQLSRDTVYDAHTAA